MHGELARRFPAPALMGIVNVTPDSFSDGGRHASAAAAVEEGLRLFDEGAAVVDVGGESTRPGSDPIPADEELRRVLPVVEGLRARTAAPISIDTSKAEVARRALAAGATFVNDVTGLGDPAMAPVVADADADLCIMHMQGTPRTMQLDPRYDDVVAEVGAFLEERVERAVAAGVARGRICVDPGIGFGKTDEHNLTLLANLGTLAARTGAPVLVGVSRKGFLGRLIGDPERDRTVATVTVGVAAAVRGAWMLRVHDVAAQRDALSVARALARPAAGGPGRRSAVAVRIRGLAVFAHHGALAAERELGQRFRLDLELVPAGDAAADSDELADAVHYGEVALRARAVAEGEPYALLERLADEVARTLLAEFPLTAATVTVHKPSAPVPALLDDIEVRVTRTTPPRPRAGGA